MTLRKLRLSMGASRLSTDWRGVEMSWEDLQNRLSHPQRTTETVEEYYKLSKADQGRLKDVGGFVGGTLNGPRRKAEAVTGRDLITLDLDNIPANETENVIAKIDQLGVSYIIYSTRSHLKTRPRLRVIMPTDRTVLPDEYEPIARKIASLIGMELCDPTTFEASRLMYFPSCSIDGEFVYRTATKAEAKADSVLAQYADWHDISLWPQVPGESEKYKTLLAKQEDPTKKEGVVGAFCRCFNIYRAIEELIPNAYTPTDNEERWTYVNGSTVGGAVIYDNGNFLYSHHATDPCSGKLVNAFDLVRLHLFGEEDKEAKEGTAPSRLPSFKAMREKALQLPDVAAECFYAMQEKTTGVFSAMEEHTDEPQADAWMLNIQLDSKTGKPCSTRNNIYLILENHALIKGKIAKDDFSGRILVLGATPWKTDTKQREWNDTDDAGLLWWLETGFGITGTEKILNAFTVAADKHTINPVKLYLEQLHWDGTPRLDTLFVDYLGANDNDYTRAVARKSLVAAVKRVFEPGCKYDQMPVLIGPQGIGKSTLLAILGRDWFSDSVLTFEGKEAAEQIQGVWIVEIGEMASYNKSDTNQVKLFLSKQKDIYRQAYGRRTETHPRRCVFFGTSNFGDFLKDPTGNRRFWPVDVGILEPKKSVITELTGEVDQIWAEAVVRYRLDEPIIMENKKLADMALQMQKAHNEANPREGIVLDYLEREFPEDYENWSLNQRRMFLDGSVADSSELKLVKKQKVCALEIWCECFHGGLRDMKRVDAQEINQIISRAPGWERNASTRRYGYCGHQRGFERK